LTFGSQYDISGAMKTCTNLIKIVLRVPSILYWLLIAWFCYRLMDGPAQCTGNIMLKKVQRVEPQEDHFFFCVSP